MKIYQKVLFRDNKVKVTKIKMHKDQYMKFPIILQARIEWRNEAGKKCVTWVNGYELEFIDN